MRISASEIQCKNYRNLTLFKIEKQLYFPHSSIVKKLNVASPFKGRSLNIGCCLAAKRLNLINNT